MSKETTPKEALEAIRVEFQSRLDFPVNLTPEYRLVKQALTELEGLKRDVARFMDLMDKYMTFVFLCDEETNDEYDELSKKLMKVGK